MQYRKALWIHDSMTEPNVILCELDAERWEVRKVEICADGSITWADSSQSTGNTGLAEAALPPDEEINSQPEFRIAAITRAEFEVAWSRARRPERQSA